MHLTIPLRQAVAAMVAAALMAAVLAVAPQAMRATHTSGYDSGEITCYKSSYVWSDASYVVQHSWRDGGYDAWYNSSNIYRSSQMPWDTWWAVEWDHDQDGYGAACNP